MYAYSLCSDFKYQLEVLHTYLLTLLPHKADIPASSSVTNTSKTDIPASVR